MRPPLTLPTDWTPTETDLQGMADALAMAEEGLSLAPPNPSVGCSIWSPEGLCIGRGHTQETGGPHAEVMAMRDAIAKGASLAGSTAYVTLEPCAHHGRTPPCADALVKAGLARVVMALEDPNPLVAGQGRRRLEAHGITVQSGLGAGQAQDQLRGFLHRMRHQRPWVRMKMAASLDARTALPNGESQWITSPAAREDGHRWRARAGAVLTGIGTVLADDPRLDVRQQFCPARSGQAPRQPLRIVLDRALRCPSHARILQPPGLTHLVYDPVRAEARDIARLEGLATLWPWPGTAAGETEWDALWRLLASHAINEVHVEAGATLSGAMVAAHAVDECLLYMAPVCLGPGRPLLDLPERQTLPDHADWTFFDAKPVGPDMRLRLLRQP